MKRTAFDRRAIRAPAPSSSEPDGAADPHTQRFGNGAGRGNRTPTGVSPKVFEFSASPAPRVTIGHNLSLFSNLAASNSRSVWPVVPSGNIWC
jgi:hypothetical protein